MIVLLAEAPKPEGHIAKSIDSDSSYEGFEITD
jgi:hypothetical protein